MLPPPDFFLGGGGGGGATEAGPYTGTFIEDQIESIIRAANRFQDGLILGAMATAYLYFVFSILKLLHEDQKKKTESGPEAEDES